MEQFMHVKRVEMSEDRNVLFTRYILYKELRSNLTLIGRLSDMDIYRDVKGALRIFLHCCYATNQKI